MTTGAATAVIVTTSLVGAFVEALVAFRWYEPPARDGETPDPVLESGLFFVVFAVMYGVVGLAISAVNGMAPPVGLAVTLLLTPAGGALAYAAYTDRMGTVDDAAQQYMGTVFGVVIAAYPLLLLPV